MSIESSPRILPLSMFAPQHIDGTVPGITYRFTLLHPSFDVELPLLSFSDS